MSHSNSDINQPTKKVPNQDGLFRRQLLFKNIILQQDQKRVMFPDPNRCLSHSKKRQLKK